MAATEIERVFRGHMGRNARRERQAQHAYRRDMALWNYFAVQVQKSFRGYYSRKYRKDLAKRRRYLRGVEAVGDEVREKTKEFARLQEEVSYICAMLLRDVVVSIAFSFITHTYTRTPPHAYFCTYMHT